MSLTKIFFSLSIAYTHEKQLEVLWNAKTCDKKTNSFLQQSDQVDAGDQLASLII